MSSDLLDFKIVKLHCLPEGNRVRAFVDLSVNNTLIIKGLRVIDGDKGLFVSMPSELGKNDRWYEKVRCLDKAVQEKITQKVLEAYQDHRE